MLFQRLYRRSSAFIDGSYQCGGCAQNSQERFYDRRMPPMNAIIAVPPAVP